MNREERIATMEANHASLQNKFEKLEMELKEEIAQAQRNTVGQIASMLGLPDPIKQKGPMDEAIPLQDSPYHLGRMGSSAKGPHEVNTPKAQVQFNTGTSTSARQNVGVGHEMEMEVQNFDEIEDKAKLESRCEKLEEIVKTLQETTIGGGVDARELILVDDLVIPPKFKTFEFEKFDGKFIMDRLIEESDPDAVKFIVDVYWLQYGGVNPASYIKKMGDRAMAIHFKDYKIAGNQVEMAEVGEGNLDWDEIIAACDEAGAKWAMVEQDICKRDPFESLKMSYDYLTTKGFY